MKIRLTLTALAAFVLTIFFASVAQAAVGRTFVSNVGDDSNAAANCPRSAPCRSFQAAFNVTNAGGEVVALDTAGYGTLTITRAVTIVAAPGAVALIAVPGGANGVTINAGANDVIVLRNLQINGSGVGSIGAQFNTGRALYVEDCIISGLDIFGIHFKPTAAAQLSLKDTELRNNNGFGVYVTGVYGAGSGAKASIINSRFEKNDSGLVVGGGAQVSIRESVAAGNNNTGITAQDNNTQVNVESSMVSNNGTGIYSISSAIVRVANSVITNNTVNGILNGVDGGSILSRMTGDPAHPVATNTVEGNAGNENFTGTYAAK